MKKTLLNNPGLKLLSLAIALIIWLAIVNVNDPLMSRTIHNVPVHIVNGSYIESLGKSYRLDDEYDTITVQVTGNRSAVESLTADNITAEVDLTEIVSLDSDPIMVPVRLTSSATGVSELTSVPDTVKIELEEMVSEDFVITGTTGSTKPASGYQVAKLSPEYEKVTITGPSSIIDIIDKVEAPVDVTDMTEDANKRASLVIYDKNGSQLTENQRSYLKFNIEVSDVSVGVELYEVLNNVEVTAENYQGTPSSGYQVTGITVVPNTISVVGDKENLEALKEAGSKIVLDSSLIDVSDAKSSFDIRIDDISKQLPEGISLASSSSGSVVISVEILPYNSASVKVPTAKITKNNLENGMNAVFSLAEIEVTVEGTEAELQKLSADDIELSVDLSGLKEGTHNVTVDVKLPDGYSLLYPVVADVTLSSLQSTSSNAS